MILTLEQQRVVEENMGLVGKVIKDKVHSIGHDNALTYEDLFQIGCIGLCKAAATDKGGCFSTYAYRLIWNEICDHLIKTTRISNHEQFWDPNTIRLAADMNKPLDQIYACEQQILMEQMRKRASGITAKGILCLELTADGYTSKEIGELLDAKPATVRLWMTKGRRFLSQQPEFQEYKEVNK